MSTFAERLKSARFNARMVQDVLAEKTGIPQSTIAQYELGLTKPRNKSPRIKAIADALKVDVQWLASDEIVLQENSNNAANEGAMMNGKTTGKRLEAAMENAGIDIKKLAALTAISSEILTEYLRDERPLIVPHIEAIAGALNIGKSWLAFGKN